MRYTWNRPGVMERKVPFIIKERYHVYTRGIDKRVVFESGHDYDRMQLLLYVCNNVDAVDIRKLQKNYKGLPFVEIIEREERTDTLVHIVAYALMPSHLHLLLQEKVEGGISRFMLKLMTAYSMYFNTKNERSGALFTRPFRSKHVDNDEYFRWALAYILLNPLELHQYDWKGAGVRNIAAARTFMQHYRYSSFSDFVSLRPAAKILNLQSLDEYNLRTFDNLLAELTKHEGEPFVT